LLQGTVDSLLCRETGLQDAAAAMRNIHNNLRSPGTLVMFTHGPPDLRLPLLKKVQWQWEDVAVKVVVPVAAEGAAAAPKAKGKDTSPEGLKVLKYDASVLYPEHATYVYICKKPYVWFLSTSKCLRKNFVMSKVVTKSVSHPEIIFPPGRRRPSEVAVGFNVWFIFL
jgi:hypothetical protein